MIVYVVLEDNNYTEYDFCGVYATFEQANARIDEIVKDNGWHEENRGLYIQEVDLEVANNQLKG